LGDGLGDAVGDGVFGALAFAGLFAGLGLFAVFALTTFGFFASISGV